MNGDVTLTVSRKEAIFLQAIIHSVTDDAIEAETDRDYMVLDMCGTLNKRIEDALKR